MKSFDLAATYEMSSGSHVTANVQIKPQVTSLYGQKSTSVYLSVRIKKNQTESPLPGAHGPQGQSWSWPNSHKGTLPVFNLQSQGVLCSLAIDFLVCDTCQLLKYLKTKMRTTCSISKLHLCFLGILFWVCCHC